MLTIRHNSTVTLTSRQNFGQGPLDLVVWHVTATPDAGVYVTDQWLSSPGDVEAADAILNPTALKRPCTLGTLHLIYSALAAAAAEPDSLMLRVTMYERLYRRALDSARVHLDLDGDGVAEVVRALNVLELQRV